jgi:leucyl-tRNA synthetase
VGEGTTAARPAAAGERALPERYDPAAVEAKWRRRWEEAAEAARRVVRPDGRDASCRLPEPGRRKHYALTMFPYPSGDLHIGHWYAMVPADAHARYRRMCGDDVIFPMGFDAFGLPAENAAIKHGVHPFRWTMANIERMRRQLRSMGARFDWEREIVTCLPEYYRWNQWLFLRFYEKGLAYKKFAPVDFCPSCNTTLAREQVLGPERVCERCETPVIRKDLDQWFFRITAYAEELLDFRGLDWPERVITMQRNWIGRSEGVQFAFAVAGRPDLRFEVFTTRIDTVYGVTFCVLAPEHPLVEAIAAPERLAEVRAYRAQAARRSEIERLSTERERTGVFTGAYAVHPLTGEPVPIWIADYVLTTYGTGAIMAVPAHDERDFDFARRYGLPVRVVIAGPDFVPGAEPQAAYTGPGVMVNSGPYSGLPSDEGWRRLAEDMEARGLGRRQVHYRLRDWLISRQRYWGTPIPIVYCPACGTVPVPDDQLPVLLPEDAQFLPTGESPLKYHEGFRRTRCPRCGGPAERETDTMDTFVDSSWYQFRYLSPHDETRPFDPEAAAAWMPVDLYTGGVEHATMHLLYVRFFTKAMRDLGLTTLSEPFPRLFNQGVILGENSEKMSKSRGNVVNPDDLVARYGADAVRVYLMFIGPWEAGGPWNPSGIEGAVRFLQRVWRAVAAAVAARGEGTAAAAEAERLRRAVHRAVRRVTEDIERFGFNTAIAALMTLVGEIHDGLQAGVRGPALEEAVRTLVLLLAPFAPHLAEECWEVLGGTGSVHEQAWPAYDPALVAEETVTIAVQVDGRLRDRVEVPAAASEDEQREAALRSPKVAAALGGAAPRRVVVVPGKLVNVVTRG